MSTLPSADWTEPWEERGASGASPRPVPRDATGRAPRLGFLGVGWIGRSRLEALARSGAGEVVAVADPSRDCLAACGEIAPDAAREPSLEALLSHRLDGVVIATPSALHAEQSARALASGVAVFCQKPLGRTEVEQRAVIDAARAADRLLGVDLSYRHTRAAQKLRALAQEGALGRVYALDLVFHNAYGPDKAWFYRRSDSGGGCLMDLGTHLVDLAFWLLDEDDFDDARGRLLLGGEPLPKSGEAVEDYAVAELTMPRGAVVRVACSWGLPAGRDAVISAELYGTNGGAAMRNVDGSFYEFVAERYHGTATETLVEPPDAWGGRALVAWAERLARDPSFDPEVESLLPTARVIDRLYGR